MNKLIGSDNYLEYFLDASPNGVMILLPLINKAGELVDFQWHFANRQSGKMLGHEARELTGKTYRGILTGTAASAVFADAVQVMASGQNMECQSSFDTESWFLVSLSKLDDSLVITLKDYKRLQESEALFRALFEQSNDAVFIYDLHGKHKAVNQKAADLLGYTLSEINELSITDISAEADKTSFVLQRLLAGETIPTYERILFHRDGGLIPLESNTTLVHDQQGQPLHFQTVARDIRERKKVENQLRASERQFRALFEQTNDAVFINSLDGKLLRANQKAADMLGYTVEELETFDSAFISAEQEATANVLSLLADGEHIPVYERLFRHKDGTIFPVEVSIEMMHDEEGKPLHIQGIVRDIRERKAAENQLRESERQFRALFEQSNDAVFILDFKGQHKLVNHRASELLGYSVAELEKMNASDISAEQQHSSAVLQRILAGEKIAPYERQFRHKDGSLIPVEINVELVRDKLAQPLHIQSVVRDIRARKKAELELQLKLDEERTFQTYLKSLQDIVIELTLIDDMDRFYRRVVELGLQRFGFERMGLLLYRDAHAAGSYGTDRYGTVIPEPQLHFEPESLTSILARALQRSEHFVFDEEADLYDNFEWIGKGQNAVAVLWHGAETLGWLTIDNALHQQPISYPQREILALYALSVGSLIAQKQTQQALRESEALYRSIVTMMAEGVLLQAPDGTVITANAAAAEILGLPIEKLIGLNAFAAYSRIVSEDGNSIENDKHPVTISLRTAKPLSNSTIGLYKMDGELTWLLLNAAPLFQPHEQQPYAILITFSDITKRREAEQQALELQIEKERMKVLNHFIQGSSHEFRTPLAIIKSNSYLMKRQEDAFKRAEKAEIIEKQIERILNLLDMLTKMSQLDSDIKLKLKSFYLMPMLENCAVNLHALMQEKGIQFSMAGEDAIIFGSEDFIYQAFFQILHNAVQFTHMGGNIRLNISMQDERVCVRIEDDGIGMSDEVLSHIFERFYRMDSAHTTAGFGLGLPLAQAVIEKHNGSINVQSEAGKGSRFIVCLPLKRPSPN